MDQQALDRQIFPEAQCPGCQTPMRVIASQPGQKELHAVTSDAKAAAPRLSGC
jgi:hypothetical protein